MSDEHSGTKPPGNHPTKPIGKIQKLCLLFIKWFRNTFLKEGGPPATALIGWLTVGFGILGLFFATGIAGGPKAPWNFFCFLALVCLGAMSSGFFVGFLFGIPKVLQGQRDDSRSVSDNRQGYEQRVNTNLEQISDWLTKILVGVGLVQLNQAPAFLWRVSTKLSQAYSPDGVATPQAIPVVCSSIVFYSILGLISGYLITRLYFSGVFAQADQRRMLLTEGGASGSVDSTTLPPSAMKITSGPKLSLSDDAKPILATLAKHQKELFGLNTGKRWTFTISPEVSEYSGYLRGVSELLDQKLLEINPGNGHVMLSNNGLTYVSKFPEHLGEVTFGPFDANR